MTKTEIENLKKLIPILKEEGISHFKHNGLEISFKDIPMTFDKTGKKPVENIPSIYDVDTWTKDNGVTR